MPQFWTPPQKPEKPAREHGPLELYGHDRREHAKKALQHLVAAMELQEWGPMNVPPSCVARKEVYRSMYWQLGRTLLGDDCPDFEELC